MKKKIKISNKQLEKIKKKKIKKVFEVLYYPIYDVIFLCPNCMDEIIEGDNVCRHCNALLI